MSDEFPFSPKAGADYLAIGAAEILWFMSSDLEPEEPGDEVAPEWSALLCGWQTTATEEEGVLAADDVSSMVEQTTAKPITSYPIFRVEGDIIAVQPIVRVAGRVIFHPTTPLSDSALTGLYEVRYVVGAVGLAYSEGISGYHIFLTLPHGYLVIIVAYEDDVRVAAVLRPADKPADITMMSFLDLAVEALGIESLDHEVSVEP